jgi:hypothetical protein
VYNDHHKERANNFSEEAVAQLFFWLKWGFLSVCFLLLLFFVFATLILTTHRDVAYRNLHPVNKVCKEGLDTGWTILSEVNPNPQTANDDEWTDPSNDETYAVAKDSIWARRLRCALQRHVIPASAGKKPVEYYLGFLEYKENGDPYLLAADTPDGDDKPVDAHILQNLITDGNTKPQIEQLDALRKHLSEGSNYVIVFAHGWRHDAGIGDGNVADLRLYAAHVARFLADRCETEGLYCKTRVTAIYIGWRGARVDERLWTTYLGSFGAHMAEFAAAITLFDRKPVSEQIAPSAISALRAIESDLSDRDGDGNLKPNWPTNKMIIFGHSLGGNLFATGLENDLIKAVSRHQAGEHLPPILGDLVVLINPAAEAAKWTRVQREVWNKIPFHLDDNTTMKTVTNGHSFFPRDQKPVILSITSALEFPAGGLREGDCTWIALDTGRNRIREIFKENLAKSDGLFKEGVEYDRATHVLFPTFKFDFRPIADYLDRNADRIEGFQRRCVSFTPTIWSRLRAAPDRILALLLRVFPFQNTDNESSHTIGNLDPPRPANGVPGQSLTSSAPFGTTHELIGLMRPTTEEKHNAYFTIATAPISCPPANYWLQRARVKKIQQNGTYWDSEDLSDASPGPLRAEHPALQFLHGFESSGIAPITRANDPFWNMRAFDNALSKHGGYRLTSFICAMNQLVMDDITTWQHAIANTATTSTPPESNAAPH